MRRVTIILDKQLEIGAAANVASLLMGQASLNDPSLYSDVHVFDKNNVQHAGIQYSTVLLKAGSNQLLNLVKSLPSAAPELSSLVFSQVGQQLNNAFEQYLIEINSKDTEQTKVVGIIIWGEDDLVRKITKKYSIL